jgi:glycosyltransferase involved in cell wall biosynthesis
MPTFSIVIPVFNKEKFVAKTVESVLNQTFSDYEIIVINDGSTDASENIIQQFNDNRIRYFSKKNEGVAVARNYGIEKASADFICFLDADDYWFPRFLETMNQYIQKLPEQKVFACAIEIETKKKSFAATYSIDKKSDYEIVDFFQASQKECVLWASSVCIHKSVFDKVGNFDTNIKKGEDTELWIRIGLRFPILFVNKIMAKYVYDHQSISRKWNYFFEAYTFDKYALEEKNNPKLKQYLDLNRFSAVIKCRLNGEWRIAIDIESEMDLKNLSLKKRVLLNLPPICVKLLIRFKVFLANIGLGNSVFR